MLAIISHLPRSLIQFALPALMLLISAVTLQTSPLQAQADSAPAARVKDILSLPYSNSSYGRADSLTVVGDKLFFAGGTRRSGTELCVSDGTEAGTRMVKDIFPGSRNAGPSVSAPAVFGEVLFFSADDGSHGRELWLSDGTVAADAGTKLYGRPLPELSYQVRGLLNGDTAAGALTGALATTATASSPVGSYPISQGTLAATNYSISFTGAALTITPAPLAVRADNQTGVEGGPLPELTYVANGLVNGDSVTTTLTGSLATTATVSSPVGSYLISQGTLAAANYTISFTSGTLRVTQAPSAPTWHLYLPFIERGPGNDIFTARLSNRSTATLNSQGEHSAL